MNHYIWAGDFVLSTKSNCLTPIQARQHVRVTVFDSTCSYVDRDKMLLSWVRKEETFVLCECKKCRPPRNGL
jgi:hypothetical protein